MFATIAFYLCGAAILGRIHLVPQGSEMIRTLSLMYQPVFGSWAQILFLFGAFAVLYSMFFIANAGQARMCADAFGVLGATSKNDETHRRTTFWLSGLFSLVCLGPLRRLSPRPEATRADQRHDAGDHGSAVVPLGESQARCNRDRNRPPSYPTIRCANAQTTNAPRL
jgi:hypothetical protein